MLKAGSHYHQEQEVCWGLELQGRQQRLSSLGVEGKGLKGLACRGPEFCATAVDAAAAAAAEGGQEGSGRMVN